MINRLKSLELIGYKTFAKKTDFRFPAQLTAIVGPNGSGKSNIADAVRWVLGEQAYSLLRGKKTVDMIFSGSEQRARASMAQASITFDNQDGWLPIDFEEVNLTRRAYRNGENAYLINKQRVRLKDFNELLANSGLAERNYTVIGQGLVDSALSLRPEERRRFFEEASGIGLYKGRRDEAIGKLEKTRRNVERISDIINELQPRLSSLKKQEEKSVIYHQIESDLNIILRDWYGYHWYKSHEELKKAIDFHASQKNELEDIREKRHRQEEHLKSKQEDLNGKREKLSRFNQELSFLYGEKEENTRKVAVLEERRKGNKENLFSTNKSINSFQDMVSSLSEDIREIELEQEKLKHEITDLQELLDETQSDLLERKQDYKKIESQIDENREIINDKERKIIKIKSVNENVVEQINALDKQNNNIIQRIDKWKQKKRTDEKEKEEFEENIHRISNRREQLGEMISSIDEKIKKKNSSYSITRDQTEKISNIIRKNKSELALITEAQQAFTGFSTGAINLVQARKEGKIAELFLLLIDQINVEKEFERAIAAVFGPVLEGLIIENPIGIKNVIDFVKRNNAPQAVLIRELRQSAHFNLDSVTIPFMKAEEVVECDQAVVDILHNILHTSLIVQTEEQAEKLIRQLPIGYKVVTKDGTVFESNGVVIAGKETRQKSISRKREKREIEESISQFSLQLANFEATSDSLEQDLLQLETDLDSIKKENDGLLKDKTHLEFEIHKINIELAQYQGQIEEYEKTVIVNKQETKAKQDLFGEQEESLHNIEQDIVGLREKNKGLVYEIQQIKLENLNEKLAAILSKKAVSEQVFLDQKKRLMEKQNRKKTAAIDLTAEKEKGSTIEGQLLTITQETEELIKENTDISKRIEDIAKKASPLEKDVETEISQQSQYLEQVDVIRKQFAVAERHEMQSQMRVEKIKERIENLRKKIQDDFGLIRENDNSNIYGPKPLPLEGLIAELPEIRDLPEELSDQISQLKSRLNRVGPINPNAEQEYQETNKRSEFLRNQLDDLNNAESDLRKIVKDLDDLMRTEFMKTFNQVEKEFKQIFKQLFNGGSVQLIVDDTENLLDAGIEIEATLPGKRKQELALLSGGERSLTAVALIFALLKISPTPFCILDEVDAMLDESNVMRVGELLEELSEQTQFIVITHNRNTVQLADILYGVTMGKDSVSKVISLKLDELTDELVQ